MRGSTGDLGTLMQKTENNDASTMQVSFNQDTNNVDEMLPLAESPAKDCDFTVVTPQEQTNDPNLHETILDEYLTEFEKQIQQSSDPS